MVEECGGTFGWGMFNCMLASGTLRSAGALAGAVDGAVEEIESGVPHEFTDLRWITVQHGERHDPI